MPLAEFAERYPALTTRLKQAVRTGRVAHGYMLIGDHSERLNHFAIAFLQARVCEQPLADGDGCGRCQSCHQIATATYPHMKVLKPQSKSRQIRVDDIYELEHFLHLTTGGRTRVAVIQDADRMNVQTQNAFLKTLEEPAPNTVIMMLTCNPSLLLATIRSRCQVIALLDNQVSYDLPAPEQLFSTLATLRPKAGALVATGCCDSLINLLADVRAICESEGKAFLQELVAGSRELEPAQRKQQKEEAEALIESQYKGKRQLFLSALHTWFSQEFIRANGIATDSVPNPEFYSYAGEQTAATLSTTDARRSLNLAEKLIETLNYNVDEKLAIDDFCQTLCAK
ncbi:hypothetical protein BVY04_03985 [bacterium M21]|nr:hypothetical protein BVY04_03985 [bacterium M21]